jgi:hypothetical protein
MHLTAEETNVLNEISGMVILVPIVVANIIQQLSTSLSDGFDRELSWQ